MFEVKNAVYYVCESCKSIHSDSGSIQQTREMEDTCPFCAKKWKIEKLQKNIKEILNEKEQIEDSLQIAKNTERDLRKQIANIIQETFKFGSDIEDEYGFLRKDEGVN